MGDLFFFSSFPLPGPIWPLPSPVPVPSHAPPPLTHPSLHGPTAKAGHIVEIVHLIVSLRVRRRRRPVAVLIVLRLIGLDQMCEEVGVEIHGKIKRHVVPCGLLHGVIGIRVAVGGGLELIRPVGGGVHGGSFAEVGEEAKLVRVLRRTFLFRLDWLRRVKAGDGPHFLFGLHRLPLVLEPTFDLFQYLQEFGAKSVHILVVQRGHSLEMNEELLEIERDLDILVFEHCSKFCCTSTDGKFDKDDNSVDEPDIDECWSCADLFDAIEASQSVHAEPWCIINFSERFLNVLQNPDDCTDEGFRCFELLRTSCSRMSQSKRRTKRDIG